MGMTRGLCAGFALALLAGCGPTEEPEVNKSIVFEGNVDELIVPNLDQDISFFYDPGTKKLKKRFEIYPEALEERVKLALDLERAHSDLLKQIQAERHHR